MSWQQSSGKNFEGNKIAKISLRFSNQLTEADLLSEQCLHVPSLMDKLNTHNIGGLRILVVILIV